MTTQGQRLSALEVIPYALWVCIAGGQEGFSAIVVTWVSQISFSPTLIGVALENDSDFLKRVLSTGEFTLAMLPREGGKDMAKRVLKNGGTVVDPEGDGHVMTRYPWVGVPSGALGALRLAVDKSVLAGDHTLVIGRVTEQDRWVSGPPLHLSDTGWKYTRPGADMPPASSQNGVDGHGSV